VRAEAFRGVACCAMPWGRDLVARWAVSGPGRRFQRGFDANFLLRPLVRDALASKERSTGRAFAHWARAPQFRAASAVAGSSGRRSPMGRGFFDGACVQCQVVSRGAQR